MFVTVNINYTGMNFNMKAKNLLFNRCQWDLELGNHGDNEK